MRTEKINQTMKDGTIVAVNRWFPDDEDNIKAVIVLSHGMLEHALRYDRIGSIFAENGYVFNAHDHRGHGKTANIAEQNGTGKFRYLACEDGFNKVESDLEEVISRVHYDFPDKKIILLGHSFGSFVSQALIERTKGFVDGCILCGSTGPINFSCKMGKMLESISEIFHKPDYQSITIQKIAFSGYLKRIPNAVSGYEWLSSYQGNVDMYLNDSWCGGIASIGFFKDLFNGLLDVHKKRNMKKIDTKLPVYIIYGSEDPVGKYGKTLKNLYKIYKKNGIESVEIKSYEGDRHEILNELDSDNVINDIFEWISEKIK